MGIDRHLTGKAVAALDQHRISGMVGYLADQGTGGGLGRSGGGGAETGSERHDLGHRPEQWTPARETHAVIHVLALPSMLDKRASGPTAMSRVVFPWLNLDRSKLLMEKSGHGKAAFCIDLNSVYIKPSAVSTSDSLKMTTVS
jgi:hypothetical protein